jgi:hypothetical protein
MVKQMGCSINKSFKWVNSTTFERDAIKLAIDYRGITWNKACKRFPILNKHGGYIDIPTQCDISAWLDFPISFFYRKRSNKDGGVSFTCGSSITTCSFCGSISEYFCDFPMGDGRTCDLPLCKDHKKHREDIAQDIDFCPHHWNNRK